MTSLARHDGAASGIQRVAAGLAIGLRDARGARPVRFCGFDRVRGFAALADAEVDHLLDRLERGLERARDPRSWIDRLRRWTASPPLRAPFAPGDALFNPGFASYKPDYAAVAALLGRAQVHYVGFVYDLLPVLFPEWLEPDQQSRYRDWLCWTARSAALLLCCSRSTQRDALRFFADAKIATGPIETVRLGDELPRGLADARAAARAADATARPFVLYVSTLDARKNHALLLEVWRRLLAAHGPERIPDLVFVGKRRERAAPLVAELERTRFLAGRVAWRERVDDAELARLYADCLFTVYPSRYEGWGLPIAESLAFGKGCVASSASSLPEAGGDFADYHDPDDADGALALIERMIFDAAHRESRERRIRESFRARSWQQSAAEVLARIEPLFEAPLSRVAL